MSSYPPPTENIPTFNSSLFNNTNLNSTSNYVPTVNECGVYMYNFAGFGIETYPIYKSIPSYTNFFNSSSTSGTIPVANGVGGGGGFGQYQSLNPSNIDDEYLVHPGYGIIVYTNDNYTGILINYENTTNQINWVSAMAGSNNEGQSIKVYYKGVLL